MNKDKLGWLRHPPEGLTSERARSSYYHEKMNALDAALRAQLMHVAIGMAKDRGRTTKLFVDVCVYVSMAKLETASYLDVARAIVLIEAENRAKRPDTISYGHMEPKNNHMIFTTNVCTSSPIDDFASSSIGAPLTLQFIMDATSENSAHMEATQLCDRLSRWDMSDTTLPAAVKKIQDAIVDRAAWKGITPEYTDKKALLRAGWKPRSGDAAGVVWWGTAADETTVDKLPAVLKEFCVHRLQETWNDTAKHSGYFHIQPLVDTFSELEGDEPADDFVDAERLMGALFGDRPRRKLR